MPFSLQYRFIPFSRAPETRDNHTYNPVTGTADVNGTEYNVAELLLMSCIPVDDIRDIHTIKTLFKGTIMSARIKTPVPAGFEEKYQRWAHLVCDCSCSRFSMAKAPRLDLYLVVCESCGRTVGSMGRMIADAITVLNPYFKKVSPEQLDLFKKGGMQ